MKLLTPAFCSPHINLKKKAFICLDGKRKKSLGGFLSFLFLQSIPSAIPETEVIDFTEKIFIILHYLRIKL